MKNRAKCKLCECTIESFHSTDYVICKCGEISLDGGEAMRCYAKDFNNFLRVDDEGNIIIPKVIDANSTLKHSENDIIQEKPTRKELLDHIDQFIITIDSLPESAKYAPVTNQDLSSVLSLLLEILRAS